MTCRKTGHFAKVCRSKPVNELVTKETTEQQENEDTTEIDELMADLFVGVIDTDVPDDNLWYTKLKVAGQWVKFKLDTGFQANVTRSQDNE